MEADEDRSSDGSDYSSDSDHTAHLDLWDTVADESPAQPPDTSDNDVQTFDPTLPMQHSYLGTDLTVLQGRTLLDDDEGSSHWLPLLPQVDVVLVPGQTLPLSVFHLPIIRMIKRALAGNKIFGTVCMLRNDSIPETTYADVGTTAEIYEVQGATDNHSMRIKAIGRQRFKLLESKTDSEGNFPVARVKILPEIILPNPMAENAFQSLDRHRTGSNDKAKATKKMRSLRSIDSITSVWPSWVYEQYDPENLVKRMKNVLKCHNSASQIPSDPVELSFWVARSLPVNDATRLVPLRMNSAIQRLRWELYTLEEPCILCCSSCSQTIANQQDVFSMSAEGLQGTYCNVYGYVYETVTIRKANGLVLQNAAPSTEYSWFPGYAWTVAACSRCRKHIGWRFTATDLRTQPNKFWGLCRRSLTAKQGLELFK